MPYLSPRCFSPAITDDTEKDKILREKISLFRWVEEEHLDITAHPQNQAFLSFARSGNILSKVLFIATTAYTLCDNNRSNPYFSILLELLKINNFKSPRDKLICILNCCTVMIFGLLESMSKAQMPVPTSSFLF